MNGCKDCLSAICDAPSPSVALAGERMTQHCLPARQRVAACTEQTRAGEEEDR